MRIILISSYRIVPASPRPKILPVRNFLSAKLHPGGVPEVQPDRQAGLRQHPPDLREAGIPAGGRAPPGAARGRERDPQDGRRVVPHPLQQRLRHPRLLPPPHEHLTTLCRTRPITPIGVQSI